MAPWIRNASPRLGSHGGARLVRDSNAEPEAKAHHARRAVPAPMPGRKKGRGGLIPPALSRGPILCPEARVSVA